MDGASGRQATGSRTQTPAKVVIPAAVAAAAAMGLAFSHAVGILPVGLYTTDYVFLAEGAGRIALGQMPHVDFSAPVGPLVFALFALARRLPVLGPDLFAVNLLMWAIVAVPAAIVAARLRAALPALAFLGIAALVTLAPFNLEEMTGICEVNHNGIYNRHGAALLFVTFVAGLTRPRAPALDGALFAFLVAAMLLTKVTYGVAGVAFIAVACLFSAARLRAAAVAALLLAVAAVALEATTGLVSAYARDLAAMARLNAGGVAAYLRSAVWSHALVLLVAVGLMAALARAPLQAAIREARTGSAAEAWRSLETPVLAAACLLLTLWTESQSTGGAGLVGLSALAFAPSLARSRWFWLNQPKPMNVIDSKKLSMMFLRKGVSTFRHRSRRAGATTGASPSPSDSSSLRPAGSPIRCCAAAGASSMRRVNTVPIRRWTRSPPACASRRAGSTRRSSRRGSGATTDRSPTKPIAAASTSISKATVRPSRSWRTRCSPMRRSAGCAPSASKAGCGTP